MCNGCVWERTIVAIDRLIVSEKARWAYDFLTTSRRWVETNKHVTPGQLKALAKIEKKAGFKGVGDVQQSRIDVRRKGSGLFS